MASDLEQTRDHARAMADPSHGAPPTVRALWAQIADEIDQHLSQPPDDSQLPLDIGGPPPPDTTPAKATP